MTGCGAEKDSSESRIIPTTLAWVDGLIVVPLMLTEKSGEEDRGGGNIMSSVEFEEVM